MVWSRDALSSLPAGRATDGLRPRWLVDHRRHGDPQEGQALHGPAQTTLRDAGQARQLPKRVKRVSGVRPKLPAAWRRHLPEDWTGGPACRQQACVLKESRLATKAQIAPANLRFLLAEGGPDHSVLADAGHGVDTALRPPRNFGARRPHCVSRAAKAAAERRERRQR